MKITEINISGFGKLEDFYMDFSTEQVNEIIEDNGYGKSTISAFIRVMLFGFENETRNKENSERKSYRPRNNAQYGGRLYFETEKGRFVLSRIFGLKAKEDITELKNSDTGLEIRLDDGESVGKKVFGIDSESFMRSAYLGQGKLFSRITPEIQSKAHIDADPADIIYFDEKTEKLKECIRAINGTGAGALAKVLRKEINNIDGELKKRDSLEGKELKLEGMIHLETVEKNKLISERNELREKRKNLSSKAERLQIRRAYTEKKDNMAIRETEYMEAGAFFTKGIPSDEELSEILDKIEQCDELKARASQLESSSHEDMELMEKPGIRGFFGLPTFFGGLIIVLGIAFFTQGETLFGETLFFAGLVGIIYGGIKGFEISKTAEDFNLRMKKSSESKQKRKLNFEQQIKENKDYIAAWLDRYGFLCDDQNEDYIRFLIQKKSDVQIAYNEFDRALQSFQSFCSEIDMDIIKKEESIEAGITPEKIEIQITEIENEIEKKTDNIIDLKKKHEDILKQISDLDVLQEKRELISAKESSAKDYVTLAQKTLDYLNLAKESFTNKYTHPIMENFLRYAVRIFGDKAYSYDMDANLKVSVRDGAMNYPLSTLSAGEQDLTFLILRAALLDVMYPTEKPFIIMDDPFVNLDDTNLIRAKSLINEMAKRYQIIYFSCNSGRKVKMNNDL